MPQLRSLPPKEELADWVSYKFNGRLENATPVAARVVSATSDLLHYWLLVQPGTLPTLDYSCSCRQRFQVPVLQPLSRPPPWKMAEQKLCFFHQKLNENVLLSVGRIIIVFAIRQVAAWAPQRQSLMNILRKMKQRQEGKKRRDTYLRRLTPFYTYVELIIAVSFFFVTDLRHEIAHRLLT